MRTIEAGEGVRPMVLLEALRAEDIPVSVVHPDGRIVLDVAEDDDSFDAAVLAVLATHDVEAIDAAEALRAQDDLTDRQIAQLAVAVLTDDIARLESAEALTVAQLRAHLARTNKAVVALIRYLGRRGL